MDLNFLWKQGYMLFPEGVWRGRLFLKTNKDKLRSLEKLEIIYDYKKDEWYGLVRLIFKK